MKNHSTEIASLIRIVRTDDANVMARHRAFSKLVWHFQDMVYACAYSVLGDFLYYNETRDKITAVWIGYLAQYPQYDLTTGHRFR